MQRHAPDQLHRVVKGAVGGAAGRQDADDAGVVQLGQRRRLTLEALDGAALARQGRRQHFEGHGPLGVVLKHFVYLAHAAPAEEADDLEVAQAFVCPQHRPTPALLGPRRDGESTVGREGTR